MWLVSPAFAERVAALEPYVPPAEPARYYGGAVGEFIPSADYGRVYPYIGQVMEAKPNYEGHWFPSSCLYGFVDENGRIICDPVYNSVKLLTYGDKAAYVVRRTSFSQGVVTCSYDYTGYPADGTDTRYEGWYRNISALQEEYYAVVSLDGSFFGRYDAVYSSDYWYASGYGDEKPAKYEYLAVCKNDLWGVIDYDGTEILPCQYYEAPLFAEGLAAAYENEDSKEYYYINSKGEHVLGPFRFSSQFGSWKTYKLTFSQGRALILNGGLYGFIDTSGKIVVSRKYAETSFTRGYDENGLAVVITMDLDNNNDYGYVRFDESTAKYGIIDVNGNTIVPLLECGYVCYNYQEGEYYFIGGLSEYEGEIFNKNGAMIMDRNNLYYKKCLEGDIFTTYYYCVSSKSLQIIQSVL